jgi:hypothetical protein
MRKKRAPPCQRMQRKLLVCEREKCEKNLESSKLQGCGEEFACDQQ